MSDQRARFFEIGGLERQRAAQASAYLEFLRVSSMSAGVYVLAAGTADLQSPHRQDELYYVIRGKCRMRVASEDRSVAEGSVIFVAAHEEHRFHDIEEELTVLVFFAPAETEGA
jgi:mannose-6-phosphate isomerase-like protein (cupin superfamily)